MINFLGLFASSAALALPLVGVYVLFAVGIVVIYRASRVLNLAHGAMAVVPAYVFYSLGKVGLPLPLAAIAGIAGGAVLGVATEALIVRRLRNQGPVAQTVGTIAVYGFIVALAVKVYGSAPLLPPRLLPAGVFAVGSGSLRVAALWLFAIGAVATLISLALFRFTDIGLAMRAAADNRRAAGLMGVDPDRTTSMAWAIGGGLAGLAGVLVGTYGNIDAFTLGFQVLPAFVAALIGGLESLGGALMGCLLVALVQAEIPAFATIPLVGPVVSRVGAPQLLLMVVAFIVLATRGQRLAAGQSRGSGAVATGAAPRRGPTAAPGRGRAIASVGVIAVLLVFPFLPFVPFSVVGDAILAGYYVLAAVSVVLLTGWVGQISLAQAELIGVGAFITALVTNKTGLMVPFSLVVGALAAAATAVILGLVTLRVRGLYLAVATLVFAWMADTFVFHLDVLGIVGGSSQATFKGIGDPGSIPYFDFNAPAVVYLLVLAGVALIVYAVANLADSKTGRAFFALRGSEVAAASLGIDVSRYKLMAFGLAGLIAGLAGSLIVVQQRSVEPGQFDILASLFFLAIAVIGGIESLPGAVLAGLLFAGLSELFFRVHFLAGFLDIVSSGLLLAVLLLYPGGMAALAGAVSAGVRKLTHLVGEQQEDADNPGDDEFTAVLPLARARRRHQHSSKIRPEGVVLHASNVTVQFGGLTAVSNASLEVRQGEIVGLIGPNGAGKTTFFNVISGLQEPTRGLVEILSHDATRMSVHGRAALGFGRTFQQIQLFNQLSVFENLLVATHMKNRSKLVAHALATPHAVQTEVEMRAAVDRMIDVLLLGDVALRPVGDLPFGILRIVELARALVIEPKLLLLDEPASGLDTKESARFADLLLTVRDDMDLSMLLIEHDVATVTGVSDYMYVLDQGRMVAEGPPIDVTRNQLVIDAYLGQAAAIA